MKNTLHLLFTGLIMIYTLSACKQEILPKEYYIVSKGIYTDFAKTNSDKHILKKEGVKIVGGIYSQLVILFDSSDYVYLYQTEMLKNKLIDGVIKEPLGGAHQDPVAMAATLKKQLLKDLKVLKERNIDELVAERIEKFCSMGVVVE